MNRAIYPILSGALAQEREMQVFANNMANVNTAGFKQDDQAFKAVMARAQAAVPVFAHSIGFGQQIGARPSGPDERVFVAPQAVRTSFDAGRIGIPSIRPSRGTDFLKSRLLRAFATPEVACLRWTLSAGWSRILDIR
jgi:hypothetical protein